MSGNSQVDTGVKCPVCRQANVIAQTGWQADLSEVPVGGRAGAWPQVYSFHCANENCALRYHHPPGKPGAEEEILEQMRQKQEADKNATTDRCWGSAGNSWYKEY